MRKLLLVLAATAVPSLSYAKDWKYLYLKERVDRNTEALKEVSVILSKMAKKIKELERENKRLKKLYGSPAAAKPKKVRRQSGGTKGKEIDRRGTVLRLVSVFRGTNLERVKEGLRIIEEKTGAPLFAGIGQTYFVVFTTKPVPKEILEEAGFRDAYWEKSSKPIYEAVRPLHSPDDIDSIFSR